MSMDLKMASSGVDSKASYQSLQVFRMRAKSIVVHQADAILAASKVIAALLVGHESREGGFFSRR